MTVIRTTIDKLPKLVDTRMRKIEQRVAKALTDTSKAAVPMIRKRAPKAFGDLQGSIRADVVYAARGPIVAGGVADASPVPVTIVDAPHAKAVEVGSPPHSPNLYRLVEWVKLRGMQGQTRRGGLRKRFPRLEMGITTPRHARFVARNLKNLEVRGQRANKRKKRDAHGRYLPTDAAFQVARAIAERIRLNGTKPQWYVRNSITEIAADMGRRVRSAVKR